jgi:hypothetical protein
MTAAQATQSEALVSGQEQAPISDEFSIENILSVKGVEGLKEVASSEVESAIGKIKDLTEIGTSPEVGADEERGALAKAEAFAVNALNAAKNQLFEDLGGEVKAVLSPEAAASNVAQAEADLMVEKKKLFLEKSGKELIEESEELLKEPKVRVVEAEAELAAVSPAAPEKPLEVLTAEKELMDAKKKAFLGMKGGDIEQARAEIEPAKQKLETVKAEAAAPEGVAELAPEMAVTEGGQEQVGEEEGSMVEAEAANWSSLMVDESKKLEAAKTDYDDANQALNKFREERADASAPIEKKYITALTAQITMDDLAMRHAQNQIEVYKLKKKLEGMSGETGPEIDALLEEIEAKEKISHTLAEEHEAATKQHDALLEDYEHSLGEYGEEEPAEETEEEQNTSDMDTALPTGASFGGGFTAETAAGKPATPKKEGVGTGAKVKGAAGAVGGAVGRTGKAVAAGASKVMTGTQKFDASGGEKSKSLSDRIADWASKLGQ